MTQFLTYRILYTCSIYLHVLWRLHENNTCYTPDKVECGLFWHSRVSNSKVNSPILPEFELVLDKAVQVIYNFHKDPIKTKQAMLRTKSNMGTKGLVTPKAIVRSGRSSNSSEILCLSRLSTKFIKVQLKLNRICPGKDQICFFFFFFFFRLSMANNSEEKSPISPDSEFIRDFRAVPVTCKSEDDSIKIIGGILWTTLSSL